MFGPVLTIEDLPQPSAFDTFHPFIKGVFSQWHTTPFEIDGRPFQTTEQWMMFAKAKLFGDATTADAILATPDPSEQKRLGQSVTNFDQALWDQRKISIVTNGNLAKFAQNAGARRQLLATAPSMLVEANPRDWVWGCGWAVDDPRCLLPAEWRGQNLLGRILTFVRSELVI